MASFRGLRLNICFSDVTSEELELVEHGRDYQLELNRDAYHIGCVCEQSVLFVALILEDEAIYIVRDRGTGLFYLVHKPSALYSATMDGLGWHHREHTSFHECIELGSSRRFKTLIILGRTHGGLVRV